MRKINRWVFYLRDGRSVEFIGEDMNIIQNRTGVEGYQISIGEQVMGFVTGNDVMCFLNAGVIPHPENNETQKDE